MFMLKHDLKCVDGTIKQIQFMLKNKIKTRKKEAKTFQFQSCFWCGNCLYGRCIPKDYVCEGSNKCEIHRYTSNMPANALPKSDCAVSMCIAATCQRCVEQGCVWTQNFGRRHTNSKGRSSILTVNI